MKSIVTAGPTETCAIPMPITVTVLMPEEEELLFHKCLQSQTAWLHA